jgi:hypothetical protein
MIAAALSTCLHPEPGRVSARVLSANGLVRIIWCATCGAIATVAGSEPEWQSPALPRTIEREHFRELRELVRGVVALQALAARECASEPGNGTESLCASAIRHTLARLVRLEIVRDAAHLEELVALIPEEIDLPFPRTSR